MILFGGLVGVNVGVAAAKNGPATDLLGFLGLTGGAALGWFAGFRLLTREYIEHGNLRPPPPE